MRLVAHREAYHKRTGKVGAEHGEEKEFALRLDARARGKILAQMALGQQVRKKWRQAAP